VIRGVDGKAPQIEVLGHEALPWPRQVSGEELDKPDLGCEWIEVEALVREVLMNGEDIVLECQAGPCEFHRRARDARNK
jgi:hypothetical protein